MIENLDESAIKREIDPELIKLKVDDDDAIQQLLSKRLGGDGRPAVSTRGDAIAASLWQRIKNEFRVFLCTEDERYQKLRDQFREKGNTATTALIGMLTGAIVSAIGGAAVIAVLAPFVALLLAAAFQIGVGAYCGDAKTA